MSALNWILVAYGLAILGAIGRSVDAMMSGQNLWRALGWTGLALGLGLYIEFVTPVAASFDRVMEAVIRLYAEIF
ncbi:hypothetical protein [Roseobacter sp. HKCCA0434]|uniref:hypothetical protein n=1 Tax=Roseobacter sp. HKCCA0434 TaxID=3079297 RepID=UPI002905F753|nr:hypothetical protein [Roseobacter sp. HKCCA0434]